MLPDLSALEGVNDDPADTETVKYPRFTLTDRPHDEWDTFGWASARLSLNQVEHQPNYFVYISWIKQYPVRLLITVVNNGFC